MPRKSLLVILAALLLTAAAATAANREIIPAGTLLQCTLDEPNFSSKTAQVGDPVLCHLGYVSAFGRSVFPRGASLGGHLQDSKDPGHFVGKGWIEIDFDRLVLPGAEVYPLSAKVISAPHYKVDRDGKVRGKGHPTRDAVEWAIPVLWPIKVLTLPARGPFPTLKGETRMTLRLMEDVEVPLRSVANNSVPMPPWASPSRFEASSASQPQWKPASTKVSDVPNVAVKSAYLTEPSPQQQPTLIVLKGGVAYVASDYWVDGGQMHCVTQGSNEKLLPVESLDLYETVRMNRERNVEFQLRSKGVFEQ
ncbi:MAG TPA: hypothetical protein VMO80_15805 [Terriglobales bacterium]|jgi:hypothetical protein|nr:hypothetical protein [Terriglobales bacterium]